MPDNTGVTRRQRNEAVEEYTPPFLIPEDGKEIWKWFVDLNDTASQVREGFYRTIPPSEYAAWIAMTGNIVYPREYAILKAMDKVFCEESNKEIRSENEKREEQRRRELEESSRGRKSKRRG